MTNLFLAEDIPIDVITVVICAILGVMGWALVLTLHLPGIASRAQKPRLLCGPAPRGAPALARRGAGKNPRAR